MFSRFDDAIAEPVRDDIHRGVSDANRIECRGNRSDSPTDHILFDERLDQVLADLPEPKFIVEDLRFDLSRSSGVQSCRLAHHVSLPKKNPGTQIEVENRFEDSRMPIESIDLKFAIVELTSLLHVAQQSLRILNQLELTHLLASMPNASLT